MGGKVSHEFMVPAESGEDTVVQDGKKINVIEIGHIFKLGTKYSSSLGAQFLDQNGKLNPVIMGCYGIGVSRLIAAIIEQNHDPDGIIWPREVSPYKAAILPLDTEDSQTMQIAMEIYGSLGAAGVETLLDDRQERPGVKFKDADLIGIPVVITLGKKALKEQKIEVKDRRNKNTFLVDRPALAAKVEELLNQVNQNG